MIAEIYEKLLTNKKALISHYMNAKIILVLNAVKHVSRNKKILLVDPGDILGEKYLVDIPENIIITYKFLEPPRDMVVVVFEPEILPYKLNIENILITLTPGNYSFKIPRSYTKIFLKQIQHSIYELLFTDNNERYRVRIGENKVFLVEKPPGILGRAYEILRESMIEYGELTVKDAAIILSKELGVNKVEARKILSELVLRKYIRVVHGFINLY
ncbi:hypothetical protein [Staphylothermus hellenicus]|uniref:Uncharacterized protein n=1 Tax=Staphylothermus hellenicus (strain DSM 12710 / JCM 10830 / BK20S6-10-b1 / P8) TaxID=591019 RepID=D7D9G1_STAHD|nr:hypothetical protein [Staphylothermus hellenicus]ADI32407.1 hypothetical protein Shell_1314 [Staphylothermus hellenicus DSM 12710]